MSTYIITLTVEASETPREFATELADGILNDTIIVTDMRVEEYATKVIIVTKGETGEGGQVIAVCSSRAFARNYATAKALEAGLPLTDTDYWSDETDYITIDEHLVA